MLEYKIYKKNNSDKFLILLHCICGDSTIFENNILLLNNELNIITIDLPYHGESINYPNIFNMKDILNDVIKILNENNIAKAYFCGLSLGAAICENIGYYYPDRVNKLILISAANGLSNKMLDKLFYIFTHYFSFIPRKIYLNFFNYTIIPR